jgi:hypothetical protein
MRRSAFVVTVVRAFAGGIGALAGCARASKQSGGDITAFMVKSRALTEYADLDPQLGATYFKAAGASPSDREILALWYTGRSGSPATTITWTGALAWRACSYTKPPSQCAAPESWHLKP